MSEIAGQQMSEEELAELTVRCFILSIHGLTLLLPNTVVAEVTEAPTVIPATNTPEWLNGFVSWRGRNIPLLSYEKMLGMESLGGHMYSRMVVLNTLNKSTRIPFIALEIQGLPHLSLLRHNQIEYNGNQEGKEPLVFASMRVDGESVIVPNIDTIERMLENLGLTA